MTFAGLLMSIRRRRLSLLVAAMPVLLVGGPAAAEDNQSEDNPFMIDIDYTDTVSFGGKRLFQLIKNQASDVAYRCKIGPTQSANIAKVEHDETCQRIIVTASPGPFVDDAGKVLERGFLNSHVTEDGSREALDLIPVVVEDTAGNELFKTTFSLRTSNTSTKFLLRGLERPRKAEPSTYGGHKFVVEEGKTYNIEILTPDGMPLSPDFVCSRSETFSQHNDNNVSVLSGCKFTLTDARPGGLRVDISKSSPAYKDTLMFDLVAPDWSPPVIEGLTFSMTPEQQQDEYSAYLQRITKAIELLKIDQAKGEPYAQDGWYLNYLEQIRGELNDRIKG